MLRSMIPSLFMLLPLALSFVTLSRLAMVYGAAKNVPILALNDMSTAGRVSSVNRPERRLSQHGSTMQSSALNSRQTRSPLRRRGPPRLASTTRSRASALSTK
jgi:hypothetical protein